ncbi:hypothetical protein ADK38_25640, partial [Streptomyces varsoviensis]
HRPVSQRRLAVRAQGQSVARGGVGSGADGAAGGVQCPVEQQVFDAGVVVEPLQVAEVGDGGRGVRVDVRCAVAGDLEPGRLGEGGDAEPGGDAAAAGGVGLEAVDGPGGDHVLEVGQVVAVFAGG